ncbi:MAG TPA: OsmC family peroxiredoxin [Thermomicrobiales bacterium]|jgi:osmotically inducible protein OsmC|nr:OsmC family peroxiredoxin [Thermomicrobiales bacterium]
MAAIERMATVIWEGDGPTGQGVINGASGAIKDLTVTAPSRFEASNGKTSPEELVASAHASCYGMALSFGLTGAGTPPTRLEVTSTVGIEKDDAGFTVKYSRLKLTGTVPGIDEAAFKAAAEDAKKNCPISKLMMGNADITLDATFQG